VVRTRTNAETKIGEYTIFWFLKYLATSQFFWLFCALMNGVGQLAGLGVPDLISAGIDARGKNQILTKVDVISVA